MESLALAENINPATRVPVVYLRFGFRQRFAMGGTRERCANSLIKVADCLKGSRKPQGVDSIVSQGDCIPVQFGS
jgi:hypothetical protein